MTYALLNQSMPWHCLNLYLTISNNLATALYLRALLSRLLRGESERARIEDDVKKERAEAVSYRVYRVVFQVYIIKLAHS